MKNPVQQLQKELNQLLQLLVQGALFSFDVEEERNLEARGRDLLQKLSSLEGCFLTIGLLGGTGVGKSTLMNALAGSRISSTSHRRPHTDHVLIYRHVKANPLPELQLRDVPWREITHKSDTIRNILLCDLPDFDSMIGSHHDHVLHFLEHLDILVWVTSLEKYADNRFYEFLRLVPKANQNFYFVLNKVDLLFQGKPLQEGYEEMELVVRSLEEHVKTGGVVEPLIYALSAEKALDTKGEMPWNPFRTFRQQIFQQRDMKQVTDIKVANLDIEVHQLYDLFQKEWVNLELLEEILHSSVKELEEDRPEWVKAGQEAIDLWLEKEVHRDILTHQGDPSQMVGPGYAIAFFLEEWQQRFRGGETDPSNLLHSNLPEDIAAPFKRRLEWLEEKLTRLMLRKNLPAPFGERVREILNATRTIEDLDERFSYLVASRIGESARPSFLGFKACQSLTYALLLVFLLLAVVSETAWQGVFDTPGVASLLGLILSGIHTLFSTKGLAALGSFALLNLFFALHFYRSYRKRLNRASKKTVDFLKSALGRVWQEKVETITGDLNRFAEDIRSQKSAISFLKKKENG